MAHDYRQGHIPYYVDGERVTRVEYVAHQRGEKRKAAHVELDEIEAETTATSPAPTKSTPARKATSKE